MTAEMKNCNQEQEELIAETGNCHQESKRTDCKNRKLTSAERKTDGKSGKLTQWRWELKAESPDCSQPFHFCGGKLQSEERN